MRDVITSCFVLIFAGFYTCSIAECQERIARAPEAASNVDSKQIDSWIRQLSDSSYEKRQRAAKLLKKANQKALVPVAKAIVASDPETSASCLRILKSIGVDGEEASMYRVALVMKVLADNGFEQLQPSISSILREWKTAKINQHVGELRELGADVQTYQTVPNLDLSRVHIGGSFRRQLDNESDDNQLNEATSGEVKNRKRNSKEVLNAIRDVSLLNEEELETEFAETIKPTTTATDVNSSGAIQHLVIERGRPVEIFAGGDLVLGGSTTNGSSVGIRQVAINKNWKGSADDLKLLNRLPSIPYLYFSDIEITGDHLESLKELNGLQYVNFANCEIDGELFTKFFKDNPHIQYTIAAKAFLGITGSTVSVDGREAPACTVESIIEGCAAEEAGLKVGDTIIQADSTPIEKFQDLVLVIAVRNPGDELVLKIIRGEEEIEKTVKLKARDGAILD